MNRQERRAAAKTGQRPAHAALFRAALQHHQAGRVREANQVCRQILAADPNDVAALHLTGLIALQVGLNDVALDALGHAVALGPKIPDLRVAVAEALQRVGRLDEAVVHYRAALALDPRSIEALYNGGNVLFRLGRHEEALAGYDRALALRPRFAEAHRHRANTLWRLGRHAEALAAYGEALALKPDYAEALNNRGNALSELERHDEAARDFARLVEVAPDYDYAPGALLAARLYCCDWADYDGQVQRIAAAIDAGKRAAVPYLSLSISGSPALQLRCAQIYAASHHPPGPALWTGKRYRHDKIRVAYLSADFHRHATGYLMAGLFEAHDRSRFETTAISFGPDTGDDMRLRLAKSFTRFVDARGDSDLAVARLLRELEIDIAVDLKGYSQGSRPNILTCRPAPVQVSFLGYPGTLGAPYIDYLLADRTVVPESDRLFYPEKLAYLPDTYQPNDRTRAIAERTPARREAGLPDAGFVFCCFNKHYKIAPPVFDIWMRLLREVEGSVLWLFEGNAAASGNLRREAEARGVAADRLVFAPRIRPEDHLARHRLADLMLDTLPYGAHTTASDALWAGLPLVTCLGSGFAGRVAASLLQAVGLDELIAKDLDAYAALALKLARDKEALAAIRSKLAHNRDSFPLFDTDRFRRHMESAYEEMWRRAQRGEPPASFAVAVT